MHDPSKAQYRNFPHYIEEGWGDTPKKYFRDALNLARSEGLREDARILDVGCATGEFLGYLHAHVPEASLVGIDVMTPLVSEARRLAPYAEFRELSLLELPADWNNSYDLITALGILSIFEPNDLETCLARLADAVAPDGQVIALTPLNEYGVDSLIRHRKRNRDGTMGEWESSWNVYAIESIRESASRYFRSVTISKFEIDFEIPRGDDPGRTWTVDLNSNKYQLINGLKLLVDLYFVHLRK